MGVLGAVHLISFMMGLSRSQIDKGLIGTACAAENVMVHSNTSSPASSASSPAAAYLHASPKPSPPRGQQHASGNPAPTGRQGRRRTVPHPSFVESLERLAALHR